MKLVFTIALENRNAQDADLLQAYIYDGVENFFRHTSVKVNVERVRMFGDDFDPLAEYEASRKGGSHRRFGNLARPGKPS